MLLASTRRSLCGNSERGQYLEQLVKGVQGLLEASQVSNKIYLLLLLLFCVQPLTDPECYHEFCRLLVRLKSNYQLGELMKLEDYPQFIQLVAKFTITSLQVHTHTHTHTHTHIHYIRLLFYTELAVLC